MMRIVSASAELVSAREIGSSVDTRHWRDTFRLMAYFSDAHKRLLVLHRVGAGLDLYATFAG